MECPCLSCVEVKEGKGCGAKGQLCARYNRYFSRLYTNRKQ